MRLLVLMFKCEGVIGLGMVTVGCGVAGWKREGEDWTYGREDGDVEMKFPF